MEGRPPLALPAGKKNREGRAFADFGHHLDIALSLIHIWAARVIVQKLLVSN